MHNLACILYTSYASDFRLPCALIFMRIFYEPRRSIHSYNSYPECTGVMKLRVTISLKNIYNNVAKRDKVRANTNYRISLGRRSEYITRSLQKKLYRIKLYIKLSAAEMPGCILRSLENGILSPLLQTFHKGKSVNSQPVVCVQRQYSHRSRTIPTS